MQPSQDIGIVRRDLVYKAFSAQRTRTLRAPPQVADARLLRELLDEAHARIRTLEKAIARLLATI